jgi:FlaA1/EpsC-like NDP-sugar epimerase/lipopolysaccharide/colanic/teichoic acid biosynthesis glycosyltransferase
MTFPFEEHAEQELKLAPSQGFLIRLLDLTGALLGLVALGPAMLVLAALVLLTSPGPILYLATRVGRNGKPFGLYKFRSMVVGADQQGPGITLHQDQRITRIGRFLRQTKLDELPQLINVIKGDMSLVGPRPEDPRYVERYTAGQRQILAARPGITSPASFIYRGEESLLRGRNWEKVYVEQIMPHKLGLDLAYLRQRTVWTDLHVLLQTVTAVVVGGRGISSVLRLRNRHFMILDLLAMLLLPALALTLRLDKVHWWPDIAPALLFYTGVSVLVKFLFFYSFGLYRRYWRYASVNDLLLVVSATAVSSAILAFLFYGLHPLLRPYGLAMFRTVPLIDGLLTMVTIAGLRLGLRGLYYYQQRRQFVGGRRVLIVGAGEHGSLVVREMQVNPQLELEPVAFIDDDPAKLGTRIQGLPVLGRSDDLARVVEQQRIQQIIVAMPSVPLGRQRELVALCQATGRATFTLPGMYELLAGFKSVHRLPQVDIQQLLQREPIEIDRSEVEGSLHGTTVLVTGAGGSIGSELCRQIARCEPREIILLGHGENSIFEIGLDLKLAFPRLVTRPVIADVREAARLDEVVGQVKPDIIFHAAAHKHVPFMQNNAAEALANNVLGTRNVLAAAARHGVARFVLISSDKAVHPSSTMGATKRLAELLTIATAQQTGRAYMAVRFGNVLGSRGSVIPVFQRQIASGGPLTVTHPRMERYFMTIPEAVQLVLQASVLGRGAEVFVLDMGQPVKIVDLAQEMLKLSGLEPGRDIDLVFSGIRPGEKLSEALFMAQERHRRTKHEKIFVAPPSGPVDGPALEQAVLALIEQARTFDRAWSQAGLEPDGQEMLRLICRTIEQYQPPATPPTQRAAPPEPRPHDTHPLDGAYPRSASMGV